MQFNWLWLVVGLIPYFIKRQRRGNEQILTMKAIFWRLTVRWEDGQYLWNLSIPFIEHVRH